ncbi:hypothetical protein FO519_007705 [Halicephalobus sp. NKZ332]|nr:hypothetical protein FO519_007705 [Halicephalobus sp. NKZ332]
MGVLDAEQRGDVEKAAEIQNEIDNIDEHIKRKEREMNQEGVAVTFINQRNRDLQRQTLSQIKVDDGNKEDDPFTRKSGKMKPVSGKAKTQKDSAAEGESSIPVKDDMESTGTSQQNTLMIHSISAPTLTKFDPSLLLSTSESKPNNSPNIGQQSNSAGGQKEGRLSFAEYRRRKAEAASAGN